MTAIELPRAGEIGVDSAVLWFAGLISAGTGVLFGLAPSLSSSRPDLAAMLRGGEKPLTVRTSRASKWLYNSRSLLVITQVVLSTVLLIGATLLMEAGVRLNLVSRGFDSSNVTMQIALSPARYDINGKRATLFREFLKGVEQIPSVQAAAAATTLPMKDRRCRFPNAHPLHLRSGQSPLSRALLQPTSRP